MGMTERNERTRRRMTVKYGDVRDEDDQSERRGRPGEGRGRYGGPTQTTLFYIKILPGQGYTGFILILRDFRKSTVF